MWPLVLEAGIALGLVVLILWWTMAPVRRREDQHEAASTLPPIHPERSENQRNP